MHKKFYASGFIYTPTGQILLQKPHIAPSTSTWTLLGSFYDETEDPEKAFAGAVYELLGLKIKDIKPIYSYFDQSINTERFIFYTKIDDLREFPPKNDQVFQWFTFKEILKIHATTQIKHDIVVGQRVIEAELRKERGEQSL